MMSLKTADTIFARKKLLEIQPLRQIFKKCAENNNF